MKIKVVVITDVHYKPDGNVSPGSQRGDIADLLLLRAVHRINRFIHPDITVILGDICDRSASKEGMARMRETLALLKSRWLIIPGNHDVPLERFCSVFPRPAETTDVNGVRFVPFLDPEEPGFNARRTGHDLARMKMARENWPGRIVALQHVPLFPPGRADCPYNYTNAAEVIAEMRRNDIALAISGHYHKGLSLLNDQGVNFLAAPALCQSPFSFLEIDIVNENITVTPHDLRLPEKLNLWDLHVHTQFAYCSENMEIVKSMGLASVFGLTGMTFAEHSGQLYFDKDIYWRYSFLKDGFASLKEEDERMEDYFAALANAGCRALNTGLEADCAFNGRPFLRPSDRRRVRYLMGAIHALSSLQRQQPDLKAVYDEFLAMTNGLVRSGVDILVHPFRIFSRARLEVPESLYDVVVRLLKQSGVVAEINFHTQTTDPEFVQRCLAAGVKLSFGSDAHNLYEIGEFTPHLALLRECGFDGDLREILFNPGLAAS